MNTTNVSCFNIGCTSWTNAHEVKIEPQNFLQKAAVNLQKTSETSPLKTPQQTKTTKIGKHGVLKESVYEETAPSTGHVRQVSYKELYIGKNGTSRKYDEDLKKCPPKRMRSLEKETSSSINLSQQYKSNQQHHSFHDSCNISQDVQPEGKKSMSHKKRPYVSKGLSSPKVLTTRVSPKNHK